MEADSTTLLFMVLNTVAGASGALTLYAAEKTALSHPVEKGAETDPKRLIWNVMGGTLCAVFMAPFFLERFFGVAPTIDKVLIVPFIIGTSWTIVITAFRYHLNAVVQKAVEHEKKKIINAPDKDETIKQLTASPNRGQHLPPARPSENLSQIQAQSTKEPALVPASNRRTERKKASNRHNKKTE